MCQISRRSEYAFACYSNFCKCAKRRRRKKNEEKKTNFGHSYLGNGLSDFLQIWNADSPSWRATLQQIWFQSNEVSPRYKCVKMTFSFFLSIYSRCGAPASWAARHTIVCLDSCQYTHGVARRLLGPHDTLSCVLIMMFSDVNTIHNSTARWVNYISLIISHNCT